MKKKIIGITGIRSDYDLMSNVYRELAMEPDIDFSLIVTAAHLGTKFGQSYQQIIDDGIPICWRVPHYLMTEQLAGKKFSSAITIRYRC